MSRRCPICSHESRPAIEQAILNGKPHAQVARTFGFTYTRGSDGKIIGDHKKIKIHLDHMGEAFQKAMDERDLASGEAMAIRLRNLEAEVDKVIERANQGKPLMVGDIPLLDDEGRQVIVYDNRLLLAAVQQGRANLELMAKLAGRIENEPEGLDSVRKHLQSPQARKLMAALEDLAADAEG